MWARAAAQGLQPAITCSSEGRGRSSKRGPNPTSVVPERLSSASSLLGGLLDSSSTQLAAPSERKAQRPALQIDLQQPQLPPQALPLACAGFAAVATDVFAPGSGHLLGAVDAAAHAWVTVNWSLDVQYFVAAKIISDAAITSGLAGWAAAGAAALRTRDPRLLQALALSAAVYWFGGGSIKHGDPCLVDALKHAFHRARPSDHHHTFAFPSGHTTAATFICGTLLFLLLPAALIALERQQQEEQQQGRQQPAGSTHQTPLAAAPAVRWVLERRWQLWAAAATVTAGGRVLADAHWVSDTLAGACLGIALTAATAQLCMDGWPLPLAAPMQRGSGDSSDSASAGRS